MTAKAGSADILSANDPRGANSKEKKQTGSDKNDPRNHTKPHEQS